MLKKIIIYLSDELYDSREGKSFYGELAAETGETSCQLVYAGLSGRFVCPAGEEMKQAKGDGMETVCHDRHVPPWQLMESIENCFVREAEHILLVTDLPYMYAKAVQKEAAALPVALTDDKMDAFCGARYLLGGLENVDFFYLNRIYQRWHGIPWHIADTERTIIREMTVEDVDSLYEIYKEPSITRYTDNLFEDREKEKAYTKEYIETIYHFMEFGVWVVQDRQNPQKIIGRAGLSMREGFDEPELGYIIAVPYQGKGYAFEVCEAIIKYAKEQLGFKKLRIMMTRDNEASHRLCAKLGFAFQDTVVIDGKEMEEYARAL